MPDLHALLVIAFAVGVFIYKRRQGMSSVSVEAYVEAVYDKRLLIDIYNRPTLRRRKAYYYDHDVLQGSDTYAMAEAFAAMAQGKNLVINDHTVWLIGTEELLIIPMEALFPVLDESLIQTEHVSVHRPRQARTAQKVQRPEPSFFDVYGENHYA